MFCMMRLADAYPESEEESEEEDVKPGVPEATSVCTFAPSIPRSTFDSTLQSSEYESESEEEEKPKLQFRPVFVPKCVYNTDDHSLALTRPAGEVVSRSLSAKL